MTTEPRTKSEKYWYQQGIRVGLEGRTRELEESRKRLETGWADLNIVRARLQGIQTLVRSIHDLADAAGITMRFK